MQPLYFLLILIIPCVLLMMSLQAPSWFPTWDFNFYLTDGSEGCRWGDESVASFPPAMSQQRQQHQHYDQLCFCSSLPGNSSTCLPACLPPIAQGISLFEQPCGEKARKTPYYQQISPELASKISNSSILIMVITVVTVWSYAVTVFLNGSLPKCCYVNYERTCKND